MKKCPLIDGWVLYPECMECEYHKYKDCHEIVKKEKINDQTTAHKEESRNNTAE